MNISHDGTTVSFKTEPEELFLAEKSGAKPNTVRIIDYDEYEMLKTHTPKKIIIRYQEERFRRTLTNLYFAKLFGKVIVIFSWAHKAHHHPWLHSGEKPTGIVSFPVSEAYAATGPHSVPVEPGDRNLSAEEAHAAEEPSIDERFAAITISKGTLALIQSIAHGRTMNMVIKELYEAYFEKKRAERGPPHD